MRCKLNKQDFIDEISKLKNNSTFLSVINYKNKFNEIANYSIIFNFSYKNAVRKSISTLSNYIPKSAIEMQAKADLLFSFQNSLLKLDIHQLDEIVDNCYNPIIKGVKIHKETEELYLSGMVVHKKIIIPGNYKEIKSKPLTIAKNELLKLCPTSKFRQFIINSNQVDYISVRNLRLLPPQ